MRALSRDTRLPKTCPENGPDWHGSGLRKWNHSSRRAAEKEEFLVTRTITNILGISAAAAALVVGTWGLACPAMAATAVGHLGHFTVDGARIRVDRFDPWGPVAGLGQRRD